jgi:hypothetical protein
MSYTHSFTAHLSCSTVQGSLAVHNLTMRVRFLSGGLITPHLTNPNSQSHNSQGPDMATSAETGYIYRPIDDPGSQIRLLRLKRREAVSSQEEAAIVCTLHQASLDDDPDYVALSYVWGAPAKTSSTQLDGHKVGVTLNLYEALDRLTISEEDHKLWVDALCINQNDDVEKAQQVQSMSRIYSKARRVFIWLGSENDTSTKAIHQLRFLGDSLRRLKSIEGLDNQTLYSFLHVIAKSDDLEHEDIRKLFLERP